MPQENFVPLGGCAWFSDEPALLALPYTALTCRFVAEVWTRLPTFPGGPLRGALGPRLRRAGCPARPRCAGEEACDTPDRCAYGVLFSRAAETSRGSTSCLSLRADPPGPALQPGQGLDVGAIVFGRGVEHAATLAAALAHAEPWDVAGGRLRSTAVAAVGPDELAWTFGNPRPCPAATLRDLPVPTVDRLRLRFRTPVALTELKRPVEAVTPRLLWGALERRLEAGLGVSLGAGWERLAARWLDAPWRDEGFGRQAVPRTPGEARREPYHLRGVVGALVIECRGALEVAGVAALLALLGVGKNVSLGFGAPTLEEVG